MTKQRLELTWYNKDQALIPTEQGKYGYTWVDPTDPRYCQTHFLEYGDVVRGKQKPKEEGRTYSERADFTPTDDNLLILGESGDVLETLTRVPELTDKYVGQVKCIYIDPPYNTAPRPRLRRRDPRVHHPIPYRGWSSTNYRDHRCGQYPDGGGVRPGPVTSLVEVRIDLKPSQMY